MRQRKFSFDDTLNDKGTLDHFALRKSHVYVCVHVTRINSYNYNQRRNLADSLRQEKQILCNHTQHTLVHALTYSPAKLTALEGALFIPPKMLELLGLLICPSLSLIAGAFKLSRSDRRSVFEDTEEKQYEIIYATLHLHRRLNVLHRSFGARVSNGIN